MWSTRAPARRASAATSPTATASIAPTTAAARGETSGSKDSAPYRPRARAPARSRHRVRGGAGACLGAEPRARRVPLARRRRHLAARRSSRASGRGRWISRWIRRIRARLFAAVWQAQRFPYAHGERRPGVRPLAVHRRRRHLDRYQPEPRAAARRARAHRRGRLARRRPARLRGGGSRGRRAVPIGRRRRHLAARQRGGGTARPALVLHARGGRPHRRGHRLDHGLLAVEVHRRRQDLRRVGDAARRQPRPLDRSHRRAPDDRGQ